MNHRRLALLASLALPILGAAVACGSSTPNGTPASDAGSDGGVVDAPASDDFNLPDSGMVPVDATAEASVDSGGLLGANCPAVDAGTFVEAVHGPLPTVAYFGGPILTAPQIVSFTFAATANAAALQAFGQTITQTPWFSQVTADYCIHDGGTCIQPGPAGVAVDIATAADATYIDLSGSPNGTVTGGTDLDQFIDQQIAAAVAANTIPAPGPNSLYVFYFPSTTTIWLGPANQGLESCSAFGGYHSSTLYTDNTTPITYAILPQCAPATSTRALESVTVAASHEIIEATTDPTPFGVPSWYLDQPMTADAGITTAQFRNDPWATAVTFGEVADNCESIPRDTWLLGGDGGNVVQRIWSTSAAALGHNPCVPVPSGEAYYNASSDKALYVASVGETFTVDVSAFSDVARSSWRLDAVDGTLTQMVDSQNNPLQYLQLEFVGGVTGSDGISSLLCANNGTTGQIKVTLLQDPDNDASLQQEEWPEADGIIYSIDVANATTRTTHDGGVEYEYPYQFWPFAVITPATAVNIGAPSTGVADMRKLAALRAARRHSKRRLPPVR